MSLLLAAAVFPGRVVVGFALGGGPVAAGEQAGLVAGDDPAAHLGVGMAAGASQVGGGAGDRVADETLPVRVGRYARARLAGSGP